MRCDDPAEVAISKQDPAAWRRRQYTIKPGKAVSTQRRKVSKESQSLNTIMKITNLVSIVFRYFPLRSSAFLASLRLIAVFRLKET